MSTSIVVSWGNQKRARCPHCKIMIGTGKEVSCPRCGREYKAKRDGTYGEVKNSGGRTEAS